MSVVGIQAVIFDRRIHDMSSAEQYLREHELAPIKEHTTPNFYRYRITEPIIYDKFYTDNHGNGIMVIIGVINRKTSRRNLRVINSI